MGGFVVDISVLASRGLLGAEATSALQQSTLNDFMSLGRPVWRAVRARLQALFSADTSADSAVRSDEALSAAALVPFLDVIMHLPANIGDYTDFYSSRDHAYNVGVMFRGPANALQPNW